MEGWAFPAANESRPHDQESKHPGQRGQAPQVLADPRDTPPRRPDPERVTQHAVGPHPTAPRDPNQTDAFTTTSLPLIECGPAYQLCRVVLFY